MNYMNCMSCVCIPLRFLGLRDFMSFYKILCDNQKRSSNFGNHSQKLRCRGATLSCFMHIQVYRALEGGSFEGDGEHGN